MAEEMKNTEVTTETKEEKGTTTPNSEGTGTETTPKVKTEEEIRAELQKEYEKMADKRVTDAIKKKEKEWADKAAKEKMSAEERAQAEERERLAAQAKKDLDLTIKGLKLDVVDAVSELGLDSGFRNLIAVEDLASISDEDERKKALTARVKNMKVVQLRLLTLKEYKRIKIKKANITVKTDPPKQRETKSPETNSGKKYTVKRGDCLWNIAKQFYGNGAQYKKIVDANQQIFSKRSPTRYG
nr:unnamed protein product [uncultured bacterium]